MPVPPARTDRSECGGDFSLDGGYVVTPGHGLLAIAFLAAADKRRAREAEGKRFRPRVDNDGLETHLIMWLIGHLNGDVPVLLDFRAAAIEIGVAPARLRTAEEWLAGLCAIAEDVSDARGNPYVWINPSLAYLPGTDPYTAARRHRFPRIDVDRTRTPNVPFIEEFEAIVWGVAQLCNADRADGSLCDWNLDFGLCPLHATSRAQGQERHR
ncbi:hypothetical protein GCM10010278_75830 [Streptomyces melanogenes]|nr:hypothetical protein GCM10010278_75830 [Streptomyces melanogenes]